MIWKGLFGIVHFCCTLCQLCGLKGRVRIVWKLAQDMSCGWCWLLAEGLCWNTCFQPFHVSCVSSQHDDWVVKVKGKEKGERGEGGGVRRGRTYIHIASFSLFLKVTGITFLGMLFLDKGPSQFKLEGKLSLPLGEDVASSLKGHVGLEILLCPFFEKYSVPQLFICILLPLATDWVIPLCEVSVQWVHVAGRR